MVNEKIIDRHCDIKWRRKWF